jgi:hypothetical protein
MALSIPLPAAGGSGAVGAPTWTSAAPPLAPSSGADLRALIHSKERELHSINE